MCVPISRTNTWRPNQTWKTPRNFWLHFSVFKVRDCHNKHRGQQVGERFLQTPCALTQWGPPAASQTQRCLVPDRGGVSGRYVGPPAGLMNGGFLSRNHTWTEEKECQFGPRAARLLARSGQVFPPQNILFHFGWTNTVHVYIFGRTKRNANARMCRSYKSKTVTASNHPDRRQNSILNPPNFPSVHICRTFKDNYLCEPLKADQSRRGDPLGTVRL